MRRSLILHPVALTALVVLVVNDHILKDRYPGLATGKFSDFAGLALLPVLVVSTIELASRRRLSRRVLWLISSAVALGFVFAETTAFGSLLFEHGLGVAQFPVRLLLSGADSVAPIRHVADVADLIALPAAFIACLISRDAAVGSRESDHHHLTV